MRTALPPWSFYRVIFFVLTLAAPLQADPVLPAAVLDPKNAAEAWNVIRLVTRNVEQLLEEKRPAEIAVQISYCSPALRALPRLRVRTDREAPGAAPGELEAQVARALTSVNAMATAAQQNNLVGASAALQSLRALLAQAAQHFDPKTVQAEIFCCPMHPESISQNAKEPCPKCGMSLLGRRIAASYLYTRPGQPTVQMTARTSAPLARGQSVEVTLQMARADRSPVLREALLEMHTEPIHLLIEEPGLGDYHHEHPVPTSTPGEYRFSFTPQKPGPYRIWADIVPATTGVQELPFVDLPSAATTPAPGPTDTETRLTASTGGYQFALSFTAPNSWPPKANQAHQIGVRVTDPSGHPVTTLEPVMNAFAHLVGFYDDYTSLLHLHPGGGEIFDPALRGGPALGFILFAPKPGFIRLYCQVKIGGQMLFAPFNLNIAP